MPRLCLDMPGYGPQDSGSLSGLGISGIAMETLWAYLKAFLNTVKNLRTPCCTQVTKTKDSYLFKNHVLHRQDGVIGIGLQPENVMF